MYVIILKPQDVLVLLKLGLTADAATTPLAKLGGDIGLSASEFHGALNRTTAAGLLDLEQRRPRLTPLLEFLEHGIRYVFIPRRGEITRGVPTAHSAPPLKNLVRGHEQPAKMQDESPHPYAPSVQSFDSVQIVWPHPEGEVRGEGLEPLYPSSVDAARRDPRLHECLALVDALRIGRARERKLAIDLLAERMRRS